MRKAKKCEESSDKVRHDRWAKAWAEILNEEYHHWHRGAFHAGDGYRVLFGNDGYHQDARTKAEVRLVRKRLRERGIEPVGFGTSPSGYAWVLIVKHHRTKELDRLVWDAWFEACGQKQAIDHAA